MFGHGILRKGGLSVGASLAARSPEFRVARSEFRKAQHNKVGGFSELASRYSKLVYIMSAAFSVAAPEKPGRVTVNYSLLTETLQSTDQGQSKTSPSPSSREIDVRP